MIDTSSENYWYSIGSNKFKRYEYSTDELMITQQPIEPYFSKKIDESLFYTTSLQYSSRDKILYITVRFLIDTSSKIPVILNYLTLSTLQTHHLIGFSEDEDTPCLKLSDKLFAVECLPFEVKGPNILGLHALKYLGLNLSNDYSFEKTF